MDDRNDYRSQQYDDDHRMSQHEQWDDRSYRGGNFSQDQDDRVRWRGGNRERSYNRSGNGGGSREFDMADRDRVRIQDDYQGKRSSGMRRSYGSNNYGPEQDRGYGRFTSESYGGRDFADSARAPYYGYAAGTGGPGRGGANPGPGNGTPQGLVVDKSTGVFHRRDQGAFGVARKGLGEPLLEIDFPQRAAIFSFQPGKVL